MPVAKKPGVAGVQKAPIKGAKLVVAKPKIFRRTFELSSGKQQLAISPAQVRVLEAGKGTLEELPKLSGMQWKTVLAGLQSKGLVAANSKSWRITPDGRTVLKAVRKG